MTALPTARALFTSEAAAQEDGHWQTLSTTKAMLVISGQPRPHETS